MKNHPVFEVQPQADYTIVKFFGHLDAATVEKIKPVLQQRLPHHTRQIIIDLQEVNFIDSHGIGLFVGILKLAHKNHGRVVFVHAGGQPASVLNMVGFNGALATYCATMNEAYALFEKHQAS